MTTQTGVSVHCIDCNSEDVVMLNAIVRWDKQRQTWEYDEDNDPIFLCASCFSESSDYLEVEL